MSWPWQRAVVINRLDRPGRMIAFNHRAHLAGLAAERFDAVIDKDGAYGCSQSHRAVMTTAAASGEITAVFEDDAVFTSQFADKLARVFADVPADWEAFWMGGPYAGLPEPVSGYVSRVASFWTHAYIVQPTVAGALAELAPGRGAGHVDEVWAPFLAGRERTFAARRWLVGQAQGHSDVTPHLAFERWGS